MTIEETQYAVVLRAAELLKQKEALKTQLRANEAQLSDVAREYGDAYKIWGFRPEVLHQACVARGVL